jgi:hypothetical protein
MARRDGRVNYGRPALDDARFMRCASTSQVQSLRFSFSFILLQLG